MSCDGDPRHAQPCDCVEWTRQQEQSADLLDDTRPCHGDGNVVCCHCGKLPPLPLCAVDIHEGHVWTDGAHDLDTCWCAVKGTFTDANDGSIPLAESPWPADYADYNALDYDLDQGTS